jgi:uncharacterized glyoxalase superfamily protein PhnB
MTGLIPMLQVRNLQETIDFYSNHLGFELGDTWPPGGPACWCSMRLSRVRLMFYTDEHAQSLPTMTGVLYFYPEDVAECWGRLKSRAKVEWPLQDMPYGMREFAIRDCNGYILSFGQSI